MRRSAALLLSALLLTACAGSSVRPQWIRAALERREPGAALAELERRPAPEDLLWLMEHGLLLRANGRLRESNEAFFAARDRQEELYTRSLSNEAAALAWNDQVRPYRAAEFEIPFLHVYPILNFLELGELEGAVVEARALSLELEARRDATEEDLRDWPFGRLLAGLVFESALDWNDAWVAYAAAESAWACPGDAPDPELLGWLEEAKRRCGIAAGLDPPGPIEDRPRSRPARVVIVVEEGYVPAKEERRLVVPILREESGWSDDRVGPWGERLAHRALELDGTGRVWPAEEVAAWIALSFPTLPEPRPSVPARSTVAQPGIGEEPLWPVEDLDRAARRNLEAARPGLLARSAARALGRWLAARDVERRAGKWGGRLVEWLGVAAERADTRGWSTLPSHLSLRVIEVEPGERTLSVRGAYGEVCAGSFAIAPGGWHFWGCRFY